MSAPPSHPTAPDSDSQWRMAEHWPELVTALTDQSIESVSLLLRGLDLLVHKGRITPAEYKVLALPAERLRHVGMNAQQIVRFQSGRVRQSHEKIDLAYLLECVLQERRNELALMGLTVWRKFQPIEVLIDPTLGFSLTKAMLDWSTPFGNRIDLRLSLTPDEATPLARLSLKTYGDQAPTQSTVFEDNIHWLLLRQIAATDGGIDVERQALPDGVLLTAYFKRTLSPKSRLTQGEDAAQAGADSTFKSISGAHVVVLSPDESTRLEAVGILHKLGITVVGVASAAQAADAMRQHDANLVVLDRQAYAEAEALKWLASLEREHPLLPVVEIAPTGSASQTGEERPVIARDALRQSLGSSVMFTLSKVM